MKSSWRIGRIAGIDVHLHFTFLILLAWVALSHYLQRQNWQDALTGLTFIVALFTIVVLHELGHALTARRFGIRTRDITLLPIGGVARLERIPEKPKEELLVALAGPAVNVVLAALLFVVLFVGAELSAAKEFKLVGGHFLAKLMWVNVSLAVFNLLPAFPMDGGRVLRALLAMRMDYVRATNIAASIGQGLAWVFGIIGLFTNPFLMFIALFVWMGAAQEAGQAQMKSALAGLPVSRVMMTEFRTLAPNDTLARAMEHILAGCQQDFPVVDGGRVVVVLTRGDLLTGLAKQSQLAPVADVMQRNVCTADVVRDGRESAHPSAGGLLSCAASAGRWRTGRYPHHGESRRVSHGPGRVGGIAARKACSPPSAHGDFESVAIGLRLVKIRVCYRKD